MGGTSGVRRWLALTALALVVTGVLGAILGGAVATGFLGGLGLGAGMLGALVLCVQRLVAPSPEHAGPRWPWLLLHLGKFGVAAVGAWLLVVVAQASVAGLAAGYLVALAGFVLQHSRPRATTHTAR